ncbi:aconitate hydratase AcnA [Candidatus Poribacteria bacterium]|nr:aconitate hydratase AcnA [Candidatus Poribacteria bacterium]
MNKIFKNSFGAQGSLKVGQKKFQIFRLSKLEDLGLTRLARLPFSIRILLENVLRNEDGRSVTEKDVKTLAGYDAANTSKSEIPYMPARVLLQDFTGVPVVVDLAAMRDAMKKFNSAPAKINPIVPSDLVIDHSVQVDKFGTSDAFRVNVEKEYERNRERYILFRWAQKSFRKFSVVPPGTGIVHQVNLEYLASVVTSDTFNGQTFAYPDTLVGTDSHTTMINGLGVVGWGVGGIEAEAVMLGQPYYMLIPEVVGFKLYGELLAGANATDLVLTVTQMLREKGVVGKFVEFFGPGLNKLSLPDRATIANMSPEYGATMGFFPVDKMTLDYLKLTGRNEELVHLVETYTKEQGLFRTDDTPEPVFTDTLELDMNTVVPSLAGPKRPQDRIPLQDIKASFKQLLQAPVEKQGFDLAPEDLKKSASVNMDGEQFNLKHGSVVIAAITSCTNTSNPSVLVAAGLLAKKALERGIKSKPWVKTSLAPGSRVVIDYLKRSGLLEALEAQRFNLVAYGCTTCIGNSGPLPEAIDAAIQEYDLVVAAVLSGNRNFEGRIHASVKANYLASPPLVVAYALAGRMDFDFENEPLGTTKNGAPVYLRDIWPTPEEITQTIADSLTPEIFRKRYANRKTKSSVNEVNVFEGDENWRNLPSESSETYQWDEASTYIKHPPFFEDMNLELTPLQNIHGARVLALLGDSVTTDHISPAGAIPEDGPAGQYLISLGIEPKDFNSYGSLRGNHEVMRRGTFANIRIKNQLVPGIEGGWTIYHPTGEKVSIYDAAMKYKEAGIPLLVLAGTEYGSGSSRDWAAKGASLLGVKAVIAESYERIHRSNLIGMGVLPLQFMNNENKDTLGLTGLEVYHIEGITNDLKPGHILTVFASLTESPLLFPQRGEATFGLRVADEKRFQVLARLDTPVEVDYYRNGGILQTVLRNLLAS